MNGLGGQARPAGAAAKLASGGAVRALTAAAFGVLLLGQALPAQAQDSSAETRLQRIEAELRALQRKVFPGGDGKLFAPEITEAATGSAPAPGTPATTPVTDMLARMDSLESQLARLTAQIEQNTNRIGQLETRAGISPAAAGAASAPAVASAAAPAAGTAATSATPAKAPMPDLPQTAESNLSAMTGGASAPPARSAPASVSPAAASPAAATPAPAAPARAATPAGPTEQRLAAVRAIVKPQTDDPGDDEYSYGFRLWDAGFFPEAQQQLKIFVDKYPDHALISYGRNLLGRAFLDDGKPREAAGWFLQNYQASKTGRRAPDSLLYLGVAMKQLKDTTRACIALAEFAETYAAEAAGRLKSTYDTARSGLKCSN